MKYRFILSDLVPFHKIVYEAIHIKMEPSEVTLTRETASVAYSSDTLKYKCTVRPRIDAFIRSFL